MDINKQDIAETIISVFHSSAPASELGGTESLAQIARNLTSGVDKEYAIAEKRLCVFFGDGCDAEKNTVFAKSLVCDWHDGKDAVMSPSIALYSMISFGFDLVEDRILVASVMVASILSEIKNDLPYHNNLHFRKVLLHVIRMINAHNSIFENTINTLDKVEIAKLMIGACIHDLGHEGKGNIIDRKYHMAMVEKRSFALAHPYLKNAGLSDKDLSDLRVMLITTDVSPFGDPISPVNQLRGAYESHFGMTEEGDCDGDEAVVITEELEVLTEDSRLCLLCLLLQEADIINSAGLDYDITKYESVAIGKEYKLSHALPEDTLLFLETICRGRMLSDAGRCLAEDNLNKIIGQVMKDYREGNEPYSKAC